MASGYATSRPPVHSRIIEQVRRSLEWSSFAERALDVGCGAGLSTKALEAIAHKCIGIEPAEAMLKRSAMLAPDAYFVGGTAESIPMRDHSMDLITAAGSLNYVDLDLFFLEAARVLKPVGTLVVYDFLPGKSFRHTNRLDEWFTRFMERYPQPAGEGRILNPEILAQLDSGFRIESYQYLEIGIVLIRQFYIDYLLTETNTAAAMRNGADREDIRSWCAETLEPIWNGKEQEVLFHGYFACMRPIRLHTARAV